MGGLRCAAVQNPGPSACRVATVVRTHACALPSAPSQLPPLHTPPPNPHRTPAYCRYDKRHGKGKMSFKSGLMYEGDWVEDRAQGWVLFFMLVYSVCWGVGWGEGVGGGMGSVGSGGR